MKIKSIVIRNFRGLENIETEIGDLVSVIVGPNAVGKTTFLEAIRLARCLLSPRFQVEQDDVLTQIGALSPHTRLLQYSSLVSDMSKPLEIQMSIALNDSEIGILTGNAGRLALLHVRSTSAVPATQNDLGLIQYLSSPQGQQILASANGTIAEELGKLSEKKVLTIHLVVDGKNQELHGVNLFSQEALQLLEGVLPPSVAYISYFPADRAMPMGETNIQIGSADSQQQTLSHLSQPSLKYQRLKQFIINQTLLSKEAQTNLRDDFNLIFKSLLVGKTLKEFRVTEYGLLSVVIEEEATGKSFDIDQMSSGEKGLILQFLLMRRAIRNGGIALIDEPELHLNPAVCRQLLPFIVANISEFNDIQAIICTHSPEILADAFEDQRCRLFHLRSSTDISPVYPQDKTELFEALRRLGATTSDVLVWRGSLFVEGPHDVDILEAAFPNRVSGYKLTPLKGRQEIEKEIRTLQKAETEGKLNTRQLFIFDHDGAPTNLGNSELVKILQWDRYCLENYLLDPDSIYDVCQQAGFKHPPESRGKLRQMMKNMAFEQLRALAGRQIYEALEPENSGWRPKETGACENFSQMAEVLISRLLSIQHEVSKLDKEPWKHQFVKACESKYEELKALWEEKWESESDGKRVLMQLHRGFETNVSLVEFKRRIAIRMSEQPSETWRIVDNFLAALVSS
jgi:predicted ATPase